MKIAIDTDKQTLMLDDITIHLEVLHALVNPDSQAFFQFRRDENSVIVLKRYELEKTMTTQ